MDRQAIFDWVKRRYGSQPDYPWFDNNAVLRHGDNRKWYGVILEVERKKLGLNGEGFADVINVKADPFLIGSLRMREGFLPAYHMNKERWISILLDGTVPEEEIRDLIDLSYGLTQSKKKKR